MRPILYSSQPIRLQIFFSASDMDVAGLSLFYFQALMVNKLRYYNKRIKTRDNGNLRTKKKVN